jgi:hypothetical protein
MWAAWLADYLAVEKASLLVVRTDKTTVDMTAELLGRMKVEMSVE